MNMKYCVHCKCMYTLFVMNEHELLCSLKMYDIYTVCNECTWNIVFTANEGPCVLTLLNGTVQTIHREVCTVQFQMYFKSVSHVSRNSLHVSEEENNFSQYFFDFSFCSFSHTSKLNSFVKLIFNIFEQKQCIWKLTIIVEERNNKKNI